MLIHPLPLYIFLWLFCYSWPLGVGVSKSQWVVWNVGQGQWITFVDSDQRTCLHFDFGGEKSPFLKVQALCGNRKNQILLSHPDWDHYSFFRQVSSLSKLCLINESLSFLKASKKIRHKKLYQTLSKWPQCSHLPEDMHLSSYLKKLDTMKDSNSSSNILLYRTLLATGDATIRREKEWLQEMPSKESSKQRAQIRLLILGHHGSRTSTSLELLNALPRVQMAISSARFNRYGHPHLQTLSRLRLKKIPQLRTEDWGNIHIEIQNKYWSPNKVHQL